MGSKGTKVEYSRPINRPSPGPGSIQPRRPFTRLGDIFSVENSGFSSYHALQAKFEFRSWRPFVPGRVRFLEVHGQYQRRSAER